VLQATGEDGRGAPWATAAQGTHSVRQRIGKPCGCQAGRVRAELHFHILPGVDDGPRTVDEALELARLTVADGTSTVVATPHARDVEIASVPERVAVLQAELDKADVPLAVLPGVEVAQDDELTADELEIAAQGPPGARWILLEAPLFLDAPGLLEAAGEISQRGYGLLIGHPERSRALMRSGRTDELLQGGAKLQLNGSSLIGRHGERVREWAIELAASGRVAVVASDAHRPSRGPVLTEAVRTLVEAGVAPEEAERMVSATPRALLGL
jgi:protein-tyrosine phosphatase